MLDTSTGLLTDGPYDDVGETENNVFLEFETLGTYSLAFTAAATHSTAGALTAPANYTFHVGPMAELEVRDGGASHHATTEQSAFTIVAANNGPDGALDAEVTIDLPDGVTVASHVASDGTYANGVWDLDAFHQRDYRRGRIQPEEATLTLILEGANAATATATATIANVKDYSVCIDGSRQDVAAADQEACEDVTGQSWHTTEVYDHLESYPYAVCLVGSSLSAPGVSDVIVAEDKEDCESFEGAKWHSGTAPDYDGNYEVCVDEYGVTIDLLKLDPPKPHSENGCEGVTDAKWHSVPVSDHIDFTNLGATNNLTVLTARAGTGGVGPDIPATGSQPPQVAAAAIIVQWADVETVNGWTVSHYEVQRSASPWETVADNVECATEVELPCRYVDTDTVPGQTYSYRVRAVNTPGVPGPWSRPMEMTRSLTVGVPEAPVLLASPLAGQREPRERFDLNWHKPIENGSAITSYTLQVSDTGRDGSWTDVVPQPPAHREIYIEVYPPRDQKGLPGGTTKYFRVRAANGLGPSPWSNVASATTHDPIAPGVPVNLMADPQADQNSRPFVVLTWEAPTDDGAAPITNYQAEWSADTAGWKADTARWRSVKSVDGQTFSVTHTGLKAGESVHYRVRARNRVDWGDWSNPITAHPPKGVPGAPALTAQDHSATEIKLTWTKPVDRGSAILRYELQVSEDGGRNWNDLKTDISADATEYVHGSLTDAATRHYRIRAANQNGAGGWSRVRSASTTAKVPGAPSCPSGSVIEGLKKDFNRDLTCASPPLLIAQNELILAVWGPPDDGGLPITGYSVRYRRSSGSWQTWPHDGTGRRATITGLTNGTTYQVQVAAVNAVGTGRYATASGRPIADPRKPGRVDYLEWTEGDEQVSLRWGQPEDKGNPALTGYSVQYQENGAAPWTDWTHRGTNRSATITGLTNGATYRVRVAAVNTVGTGPYATTYAFYLPTLTPDEPPNVVFDPPEDGQITVRWRAPYNEGKPGLLGYRVQYREDKEERKNRKDKDGQPECVNDWLPITPFSVGSSARSYTITGLENGKTYQVQVWTWNSKGDSPKAGCDGMLTATTPGAAQ